MELHSSEMVNADFLRVRSSTFLLSIIVIHDVLPDSCMMQFRGFVRVAKLVSMPNTPGRKCQS